VRVQVHMEPGRPFTAGDDEEHSMLGVGLLADGRGGEVIPTAEETDAGRPLLEVGWNPGKRMRKGERGFVGSVIRALSRWSS